MRMRWMATLATLAWISAAGCGNNSDIPDTLAEIGEEGAGSTSPVFDPSTATALVSGRVLLDGPAPDMPYLDMGSDFYCQRQGVGMKSGEVIVGEDGGLRNVVVYVRSGHDASLAYLAPAEPAALDQDRCVYTPRVLTIMTGQELLVRNSDATLHNVHGDTESDTLFNFAQVSGPREDIEVFTEPALPVHIGCDLHRWMHAYIGVFDHPFHTTSDVDGAFTLALPPGSYEIVAWHERYGEQVGAIEVAAGESMDLNFTFGDPDGD